MKTILITGVNRGLGREMYHQACAKGYKVYGVVRNEQHYTQMLQDKPANAVLVHADVADDSCIEKIKAVTGDNAIHLLINNAGIGGEGMTLDDATAPEILELLNIYCLGAFRVVKALKNNILRTPGAVVLNMNSRFGSIAYQYNHFFKGFEISYAYRIAKAAQNMLTNCFRIEFEGVEFVSITPGRVMTAIAQKDANLTPELATRRIIEYWEAGKFKTENGILQVDGDITPW